MKIFRNKALLTILLLGLILPMPQTAQAPNSVAESAQKILSGALGLAVTSIIVMEIVNLWNKKKPSETKLLRKKIENNPLIPSDIKKKILEKTSGWKPNKKAYLRYATDLPWSRPPLKQVNLQQAEKTLNATHYGLEKAKQRILEYLAAYQAVPDTKGKVLCLIGSPGVGKTSLVRSIARAMQRKFAVISTAVDERTLRGSDSVYVGSEPGTLTKALCTTQDPTSLFLLDEIDKAKGKNTQALLEALDPERNHAFLDTFLDFGVNLSDILFIATANNIETIPQALRDRMEFIQLEPYSVQDKINIARQYFIPQAASRSPLVKETLQEISECVPDIIKFVSRSSDGNDGVRTLRHAISGLVNKQIYHQKVFGKTINLTPENIKEYIDPYYTQLRLSEPKDVRSYCNNVLRKLDIPFDVFLKIERKITPWIIYSNTADLAAVYIDWISKYPFDRVTSRDISLQDASEILRQSHIGLHNLKETTIDYLAGYIASNQKTSKILCLAGAPGVGKTTVAESIAQALGRSFTRISFNGISSLTSSSSSKLEPGPLGKALIQANSLNPVILLDELEKAPHHLQNAIIELLDPSQNQAIADEYLGFDIDMSKTTFVASVNDISKLPSPLRDRMQIIEIDPYTREERIKIAQQKLVPEIVKIMNANPAMQTKMLEILEPLVDRIMPYEAGVRALKRSLTITAEKLARAQLSNIDITSMSLKAEDVIDPYFRDNKLSEPKNWMTYCNELFKKISIPADIFKKIEQKISSLTIWQGAQSMIPLYAETVVKYPFGKLTPTTTSLEKTKEHLDSTHFGLFDIKEMILDYLAGNILSNQATTKIMCFSGAPGVGKTTIAQSIAESLGRKFAKITFGGIQSLSSQSSGNHDDLTGPGPIAKALIEANSLNPVILLDELEKAPAHLLSQLLEILDPVQNKAFQDRYLGFDMDLSKVMFIGSVNNASQLAWPLKDRMHMIKMQPYNKAERVEIAKTKLIPDIAKTMKLDALIQERLLALTEPLVDSIIMLEYGVRILKQTLTTAAEKYARLLISTSNKTPVLSQPQELPILSATEIITAINPELLQVRPENLPNVKNTVGVVNALYAGGGDGGGISKTEVVKIPHGSGKLVTGMNQGKEELESHNRLFAYIKSNADQYKITSSVFKDHDFMIADQGYSPSDGASAGIAVTAAFISALTGRPVRSNFAVTGAVDLLGNTLGVSGYRSKILGATRGGVQNFVLPECSRPTIEAMKKDFEGLNFHFVSHVAQAIDILLEPAR